MHSAQPEDSHLVNDVSQSATEQDAWRALVSSRVSRYRALRKPKPSAGANLPALDFGPASESVIPDSTGFVAQARVSRQTEAGTPARASRGAFDTNYYRRLNAESLNAGTYSLGSSALLGAMDTAPMAEPEAESALNTEIAEELDEPRMLDLELRPEVSGDPGLDRYCIAEPEPEIAIDLEPAAVAEVQVEVEPEPEPKPAPLTQGNLIVFRRPLIEPPLVPQPSRDELAEPMHNRPRILEVPEDIMPAVQGSLFPEIRLDFNESESSAPREPEIEVPLAVAQVSDRVMAGLLDAGVVMAATALFAAIAWTGLPGVPHTKPFFMIMGAVSLLLWAIYQHLFLLYAGRTVGMSLRGIRLSTFDGHTPEWKQRGSRARFMFISMASVMLGFLWAMVDEDMLCWHDRISRTFPTTSI